jgi:carbonic anhydrase/acetyltransferase-like protein (isoleucine patch superfamily)
MIIPFRGITPVLGRNVYIAPTAVIIGDVRIGDDSSIWFGTVVRGDVNSIVIGARTNVQDNSTLHVVTDAFPLIIGDEVTVGHNVVLHGCTVEDRCLVGIGAVVLDGVKIGTGSVVAAGSVVTQGTEVPGHSLVRFGGSHSRLQ